MSSIFDMFRYGDRTHSMVHTVGERYDTTVRMEESGGAFTDTKNVTVLSPEYFVKMGIPRKQAEDLAMYVAGHEGAHTRCSSNSALTNGMIRAQKQGYDLEKLNHLLQITEDVRVDYDTIRRRPGFALLRERGNKSLLKVGYDKVSNNVELDTYSALSCMTYGTDLRDIKPSWKAASHIDWTLVQKMYDKIMAIVDVPASTSNTSLAIAKECYDMMHGKPKKGDAGDDKSHMIVEPMEPEDKSTTDGESGGEKADGNKPGDTDDTEKTDDTDDTDDADTDDGDTSDSDTDDDTDDEDGDDGNGEDGDDDDGTDGDTDDGEDGDTLDDDEVKAMVRDMLRGTPGISGDSDMKEKFDEIVEVLREELKDFSMSLESIKESEKRFGEKVLSENDDDMLFKYASDGTHAGVSLAYVKRKTQTMDDIVADKFGGARNVEMYNNNKEFYDGQAKHLARKLIQDMRAAKDPDGYMSDSGTVVASKAWQPERTGNARIFSKEVYEEVGDYVVDILLDASSSQSHRARQVAVQGFVLAEAFSIAGIPCQVTQFSREAHSSVVRQLRDYDESREANIHVLGYHVGGDNRDGHAIRCVEWSIRRRPETNKVIIVLSDGAPADGAAGTTSVAISAGAIGRYVLNTVSIKHGISAVDDVAINVRRIRASGIALLGVYTGHENDAQGLKFEQTMYGNDFAFIPDINDFATVVGNYLHREILKF